MKDACAWLAFSFLFSPESQAVGWCFPQLRWISPFNEPHNPSQTSQRFVSMEILYPIKLKRLTTITTLNLKLPTFT